MSEQEGKVTSARSPRDESVVEVVFGDPWLKKAEKTEHLPDDFRFACAYDINLVVDYFAVATFLRRTETTDELWVGSTVSDRSFSAEDFERVELWDVGRVFAIKREGDELTACLNLLELLVRARHGFEWPEEFLVAGIVKESAFTSMVRRLEKELDENKQRAEETETEIIKVARKLGLSPKPTGEGPSHWFARCPGRIHGKAGAHVLFIDAAGNVFGCGYCRRKGGVEELRAFVHERGLTAKEHEESKLGEALVDLGFGLEKGEGYDRDYSNAMELYKLASAEGNSNAMNNIGWLYLNGLGVRRDLKAAVEWFEKAAQYGNTTAMVNLGNILECGLDDEGDPHYKAAKKWYAQAAKLGDPKAKSNLGTMYHYGRGVRKNYRKAAEIFEELAQSGYAEGHFYMGLYFQNGFHFTKNYDAARYSYEMGAAGNDALSMLNLGVMFGKGLGVKVDHQKALYWYKQAGERGDALAYVNIGWIFEKGLAGERDYWQALHWYRKGVAAREPHAMNNLGAMYERGVGVERDQTEAEYWYAQAKEAMESEQFLGSPATEDNGRGGPRTHHEHS
ncbi:MAG: SEL1-like repeat protein [Halobacteriota archaeon]